MRPRQPHPSNPIPPPNRSKPPGPPYSPSMHDAFATVSQAAQLLSPFAQPPPTAFITDSNRSDCLPAPFNCLPDRSRDLPIWAPHLIPMQPCPPRCPAPHALCLPQGARIWTAGLDGVVRCWAPQTSETEPSGAYDCELALKVGAPVLCLAVQAHNGLVVCGDAAGGAHAFALADGAKLATWQPHAGARTRSIAVSKGQVVTGGSDGRIRRQPMVWGPDDGQCLGLDALNAGDELTPPHSGAVVALAPHPQDPDLLVSGGQDSSLRVWDLTGGAGATPKCKYGVIGYKVWLGSVAIDDSGRRLVSDGRDNLVLVRDFTSPEEMGREE